MIKANGFGLGHRMASKVQGDSVSNCKERDEDEDQKLKDLQGKENLQDEGKVCYECNRSLVKSPQLINITGLNHRWHPECFKCRVCDQPLDRENSCFIYKDGVVCRDDYAKLRTDNLAKCSRCHWPIGANDWVRRADKFIYHLACFSCDICFRQLNTGEQFTLNIQDGDSVRLLCRLHFEIEPTNRVNGPFNRRSRQADELISLVGHQNQDSGHQSVMGGKSATAGQIPDMNEDEFKRLAPISNQTNESTLDKRLADGGCSQEDIYSYHQLQEARQMDKDRHQEPQRGLRLPLLNANSSSNGPMMGGSNMSSASIQTPIPSSTSSNSSSSNKSKRVRTTFTEDQLSILQTHFQIDSNPDGQDLERIATITGLSKRVTQVWFQNSRARQKKYMIKRKPGSLGPMGGLNLAVTTTPSDCQPESSAIPMQQYSGSNPSDSIGSRIGPTHDCFSVRDQSWPPRDRANLGQAGVDAENLDDETHLTISSGSSSSMISSSRSLSRSSMNEDAETLSDMPPCPGL